MFTLRIFDLNNFKIYNLNRNSWEILCCSLKTNTAQQRKVIIAKIKSVPPSFFTSIPKINKCETIAPNIVPIPIKAPSNVVRGMRINIEAINSITPEPIRPKGSAPNFEKI